MISLQREIEIKVTNAMEYDTYYPIAFIVPNCLGLGSNSFE